jgi:hypothetical protein
LEFFGQITQEEENNEEDLQDDIWPSWVIKDGLLPRAQSLLTSMFQVLEHEHAITAEQAFGIYDMKDTGDTSLDEFRRIMKIFFGEIVTQDADF